MLPDENDRELARQRVAAMTAGMTQQQIKDLAAAAREQGNLRLGSHCNSEQMAESVKQIKHWADFAIVPDLEQAGYRYTFVQQMKIAQLEADLELVKTCPSVSPEQVEAAQTRFYAERQKIIPLLEPNANP